MPHLVKIGFTEKDVNERANSLSSATGVPAPFEVVGMVETPWPREVEAEVHQELKQKRYSENKEFFKAIDNEFVSDDEFNQYFLLVINHAAEKIDLRKRREKLDNEYSEMRDRHIKEQFALSSEAMKKNHSERYEQMIERIRKGQEYIASKKCCG
jgi:hypothetical protein